MRLFALSLFVALPAFSMILVVRCETLVVARRQAVAALLPRRRRTKTTGWATSELACFWNNPAPVRRIKDPSFTVLDRRRVALFTSSSSESSSKVDGSTLKTLAPGSHVAEMEVKKSRFLGYASHVDSWSSAKLFLEQVKNEHPKARHWCFAFCGGHNPVNERCSDDGEPSGTAGSPILNALRGEGLSDTICVVVRYFGGVKLGAGGLIRAYGGAARLVLREAPVEILIPKTTVRVTVGTEYIGTVYELVARVSGTASDEEYGADGSLSVTITCESSDADSLRARLKDATKGSAIIS